MLNCIFFNTYVFNRLSIRAYIQNNAVSKILSGTVGRQRFGISGKPNKNDWNWTCRLLPCFLLFLSVCITEVSSLMIRAEEYTSAVSYKCPKFPDEIGLHSTKFFS